MAFSTYNPNVKDASPYFGDLSDVVEVYDSKEGELDFPIFRDRNDELLVLHCDPGNPTPTFGWSTCAGVHAKRMLMDARIIRFFYENYVATGKLSQFSSGDDWEKPMRSFLASIGIASPLLEGLRYLVITRIPPRRTFTLLRKTEGEAIIFKDEILWLFS